MKFIKLWEAIKIFNKCDDFRHIFEGLAFGQGLETFISCPFMDHCCIIWFENVDAEVGLPLTGDVLWRMLEMWKQ